ncbi:hypothetical protein C1637_21680 [Chryseobacterium lactis]|uniref:Uncharacterized protein n=1 Tax=Chryseobacterium lactis TaxID=1241981 RepID=A0A3G6RPA0_CHRLC|nr:hypothetical protein [Chryseobacterium lactis]AZA83321.1 hypothetical protein EG342_16180 [Chryseobacterium lactis]AZB03706.1 hypothetical protein EG341_07055 [Chryseobacterium lactis]PNW11718.1 hypothetical protein C1637_21680 [Chryseobacterium lactis]
MNSISDLVRKPTFISVICIILAVIGIPLIVYQFFTIPESGSLGITIEVIFLLIMVGFLVIDRFLVRNIDNKKLSVIEAVLVTGYLTYYYFTNDRSFSIG